MLLRDQDAEDCRGVPPASSACACLVNEITDQIEWFIKVFDEPVYNYTREFPFIWEEMTLPIPYRADRSRAEAILLDAVAQHAGTLDREREPVRRGLENGTADARR
jgi:hypothetical protein